MMNLYERLKSSGQQFARRGISLVNSNQLRITAAAKPCVIAAFSPGVPIYGLATGWRMRKPRNRAKRSFSN